MKQIKLVSWALPQYTDVKVPIGEKAKIKVFDAAAIDSTGKMHIVKPYVAIDGGGEFVCDDDDFIEVYEGDRGIFNANYSVDDEIYEEDPLNSQKCTFKVYE